jgi:hypothetical protein
LCSCCVDTLAGHLARLPALYQRSEASLHRRTKREVERVRGGAFGGITLDEAVVSSRATMVSVLTAWCVLVVQERPVSVAPRRLVVELAGFLTVHLDWLAAHPAAGDAAAEIQELAEQAQAAIQPNRLTELKLGPCVRPGCVSSVRITVGARDGVSPDRVSCDSGHVLRPHEWLLFDHRLEQARRMEADRFNDGGSAA